MLDARLFVESGQIGAVQQGHVHSKAVFDVALQIADRVAVFQHTVGLIHGIMGVVAVGALDRNGFIQQFLQILFVGNGGHFHLAGDRDDRRRLGFHFPFLGIGHIAQRNHRIFLRFGIQLMLDARLFVESGQIGAVQQGHVHSKAVFDVALQIADRVAVFQHTVGLIHGIMGVVAVGALDRNGFIQQLLQILFVGQRRLGGGGATVIAGHFNGSGLLSLPLAFFHAVFLHDFPVQPDGLGVAIRTFMGHIGKCLIVSRNISIGIGDGNGHIVAVDAVALQIADGKRLFLQTVRLVRMIGIGIQAIHDDGAVARAEDVTGIVDQILFGGRGDGTHRVNLQNDRIQGCFIGIQDCRITVGFSSFLSFGSTQCHTGILQTGGPLFHFISLIADRSNRNPGGKRNHLLLRPIKGGCFIGVSLGGRRVLGVGSFERNHIPRHMLQRFTICTVYVQCQVVTECPQVDFQNIIVVAYSFII